MRVRLQLDATVVAVLLTLSCSPDAPEPSLDGTWAGTVTTDGNVTTVVNEAGSVWAGAATLVEEVSIGVESGAPEYMFGRISWVHADEAGIWVADRQAPAVRQFDLDGSYVRDIGGAGQGPGEYTRPTAIARGPAGRLFVVDAGTRRINVYGVDGAFLEALPMARGVVWGGSIPLWIDAAGRPWHAYREYDPGDGPARSAERFLFRAHSSDGPTGEARVVPRELVTSAAMTRFRPSSIWNLSPSGDLLIGRSDTYRFERRAADGATTIIEMYGDPVRVTEAEADYFARLAALTATTAGATNTIPATKPAFMALLGAATGETWVLRRGPGFKVPGCNDHPASTEEMLGADLCWQDALFFDVFGVDGRFLGSVDVRTEMREQIRSAGQAPHFAGDKVTAVTMDEAGTIRVSRYRLVVGGG